MKTFESLATRLMTSSEIEDFFETFALLNPHPKGELYFTNGFTLLVAVVLSAQTTDKGVNKVTHTLFAQVDSPEKMLSLGEDELKKRLKTIGLYQTKARNIIALSQKLMNNFQGQVPQTVDELITLPGVGRKTANVVLNALYDAPVIAVDTHVFRVANRTGLAFGKTPEIIETQLMERIPVHWIPRAHHWLVLHGRYICKARLPECEQCPVRSFCHYGKKT